MSTTGVSVSTIAATATTTECHMLKVEGYKRLRTMHPTGNRIVSCPFQAGGRTWRIHCYSNGFHTSFKDSVSLYVVLDDAATAASAGNIHVEVELSLVRQPGVLGAVWPPHSRKKTFIFNGKTSVVHGFPDFITREMLEASPGFFHDDGFAVRCDITVIGKVAEKEPAVQARDLKRLGVVCHFKDKTCKRHHSGAARSVMWIREAFVKFFLGCFRV